MPRPKRWPQKETFTTHDMFIALVHYYDMESDYLSLRDDAIKAGAKQSNFEKDFLRKIQRFLRDNKMTPLEKKGERNKRYYSQATFRALTNDPGIRKYCLAKAAKSSKYQTNAMLLQEQQTEVDDRREQYHEALDSVGIQNVRLPKGRITSEQVDEILDSDANMLAIDALRNEKDRIYLRPDELEFLGLKGLHKREKLSDDDKALLRRYEESELIYEAQTKEIEERFYRTRLELMITALFDAAGFKLDEELLYQDISNNVRGGDVTVVIRDKTGTRDIAPPMPHVRKSYLRLQKMNYVTRNKDSAKARKEKPKKKDT